MSAFLGSLAGTFVGLLLLGYWLRRPKKGAKDGEVKSFSINLRCSNCDHEGGYVNFLDLKYQQEAKRLRAVLSEIADNPNGWDDATRLSLARSALEEAAP